MQAGGRRFESGNLHGGAAWKAGVRCWARCGPRFYDMMERMKQEYKSKKYEREEHR